jgi:hypothetical protein
LIAIATPAVVWATTVSGAKLVLVEEALDVEAQGIVCYTSTSLTLHSVLAQALIERGGLSIRTEAAKYRNATVGDVVILPGGRLQSNYVLAAVTNHLRETPTLESIARCTRGLLSRAADLKLESLAIPLLRVGRQFETEEILRATLAPIVDHLCGSTSLRRVNVGLQSHLNPVSDQRLTDHLDATLAALVSLGERRARIEGLQEIRRRLTLFDQNNSRLKTILLRAELNLLHEIAALLKTDRSDTWGLRGLELELRHCGELIDSLSHELGERAHSRNQQRLIGA